MVEELKCLADGKQISQSLVDYRSLPELMDEGAVNQLLAGVLARDIVAKSNGEALGAKMKKPYRIIEKQAFIDFRGVPAGPGIEIL